LLASDQSNNVVVFSTYSTYTSGFPAPVMPHCKIGRIEGGGIALSNWAPSFTLV